MPHRRSIALAGPALLLVALCGGGTEPRTETAGSWRTEIMAIGDGPYVGQPGPLWSSTWQRLVAAREAFADAVRGVAGAEQQCAVAAGGPAAAHRACLDGAAARIAETGRPLVAVLRDALAEKPDAGCVRAISDFLDSTQRVIDHVSRLQDVAQAGRPLDAAFPKADEWRVTSYADGAERLEVCRG